MDIEKIIASMPLDQQEKLFQEVEAYKLAVEREKCQTSFMPFVKKMWPAFIHGRHHAVMAKAFEDIASGKIKRLAISCPPRHTKSQFGSYLFPAWYLGKFPDKKIMQVSNTAELAVGFGRNVRNLVNSDVYKEIFPKVGLRQDSKSAGRWAVNEYGEYFACITKDSLVRTASGLVRAEDVKVGDWLVGCGTPSKVLNVQNNTHGATYTVNGLKCSAEHPIWTQNRKWVYAKDIKPSDVLIVESISDKMKALLRGFYGNLEYADVSTLVQHEIQMFEPKERKVGFVRWARDYCVRAVDGVQEFFKRYGSTAFVGAYAGQSGCGRTIQSGELSMGDSTGASQQQAQQRHDWRKDNGASCERNKFDSRSDCVPPEEWTRSAWEKESQEELRSYGDPKNIGWVRRFGAQVIARCCATSKSGKQGESLEGNLEGYKRAFWKIFGLFVGVRPAGNVSVVAGEDVFVNFHTDGDHTFFANGVLTHNCGVGGTLTGRGADVVIIDDPHSEQEATLAAHDPSVYDSTYEWYTSGPRQRLQPNGAIIIIATRWSERDLIGRVIEDAAERGKADEWTVIEFPAILPSGNPLWPEFWPIELLNDLKEELPSAKWNAQYQQQPTGEEGAIVKRDWWKIWPSDNPPPCEFIIQSWDTAFTKNERSDFSACTTWGVFYKDENPDDAHIILLDAFQKRMEFPELKDVAYKHYKEWEPDACIVEAKAAGAPLIFELRQMGIPVSDYTPTRGKRGQSNDKIARLNSVADLFRSGKVWAPDTRWARELMDTVAAFPSGAHDDLVDSSVQALMRFRQGGFLRLESDEQDEPQYFRRRAHEYY